MYLHPLSRHDALPISWQASGAEQVPPAHLGEAVALNSISYNVARSFGPAIGGFIVAAAGATAAFLVNAIFFLPMIVALLLWRRVQEPSRLPPEKLRSEARRGGKEGVSKGRSRWSPDH